MKRTFYYLILLLISLSFSSCLKSGLEDLPEYEDADITSVSAVKYRYISNVKSPSNGQFIVNEVDLTYTSDIDPKQATVTINASVPENFPADQLAAVSTSKLVIAVGLSTAARLNSMDNSPKLGIPGDWSKPNNYMVTAANGNTKKWVVKIGAFKK